MQMGRCCHCGGVGVTIKALSPSDGSTIWERALLHPQRSTDGKIYGVAYERAYNEEARAYRTVGVGPFGSIFCRQPLRGATEYLWKHWWRCIDEATGLTIADSDFYWYETTSNSVNKKHPNVATSLGPVPYITAMGANFHQDWYLANSDGNMVFNDTYVSNPNLVVWDSGNTTYTRSYTLIAAAYLSGTITATFTAEDNGIHGETAGSTSAMNGISAAAFATAVETALPDHVISCTATGGPWPNNHIDFEIEWEHDVYHFLKVGISGGVKGLGPVTRDALTGNIAGITSVSVASHPVYTFYGTDDKLFTLHSEGSPVTAYLRRWSSSGGSGINNYTELWSSAPSIGRIVGRKPSKALVGYFKPSTRNGRLIVTHEPCQGELQTILEDCFVEEIDTATGDVIGNNLAWYRYPDRVFFASDDQTVQSGCDDRITATGYFSVDPYAAQQPYYDYWLLMDDVADVGIVYNNSYGIQSSGANTVTADTGALYTCSSTTTPTGTVDASHIKVLTTTSDQYKVGTIGNTIVVTETVDDGDGWYGAADYKRTEATFWSPVNCRWSEDHTITWRYAFGGTPASPSVTTSWFSFNADYATVKAELDTVLGADIFDVPNVKLEETEYSQDPSAQFLPKMLWQTWPFIQTKAYVSSFGPYDGLADPAIASVVRLQVKTTEDYMFTVDPYFSSDLRKNTIKAMDWSTGEILWSRKFGTWRTNQGSWFTQQIVRTPDHVVVYGYEVQGDLDPEEVVDFGTGP